MLNKYINVICNCASKQPLSPIDQYTLRWLWFQWERSSNVICKYVSKLHYDIHIFVNIWSLFKYVENCRCVHKLTIHPHLFLKSYIYLFISVKILGTQYKPQRFHKYVPSESIKYKIFTLHHFDTVGIIYALMFTYISNNRHVRYNYWKRGTRPVYTINSTMYVD